MKKFLLFIISYCCLIVCNIAFGFLLPPEAVLHNNTTQRKYFKTIALHHTLTFLEGAYSPKNFSCKESLYFSTPDNLKMNYLCENATYSATHSKKDMLHFWPALLLTNTPELLIKTLSQFGFIGIEGEEIEGTISLERLGRIEKSTPLKKEKNIVLLLSSPSTSNKIWFEKDLFLPQKIEHENRTFLFKNFRQLFLPNYKKISFSYPQYTEIQEEGVGIITVETDFNRLKLNQPLETPITKNTLTDETIKEILEKFISDYR